MARFFLFFGFLFTFVGVSYGQQYQWKHTLPVSCRSVAYNPLSKGRIIFAGPGHDANGIFRSDDGGNTWTLHNTDTLSTPLNNVHQVFCIPSDTNIVLAVTPNQLYRSTNGGFSWNMLNGLGGVDGEDMAWHEIGDIVYYGQNFGYALWKSSDHGATWYQTGFANTDSIGLCALDVSQDTFPTIIQGSESAGLLARTTDSGNHWSVTLRSDTGTNNETEVPKVVFSKCATDQATGRHDVALAIRWLSTYRSLVASTDGGLDWITLNSPSAYPWALDVDQRASMISKPGDSVFPLPLHFFIGLFGLRTDTIKNGMVQETTDGGESWHSINFPIIADTNSHYAWVLKYDTTSGRIAVATDSGIYIADSATSIVEEEAQPLATDLLITQHSGLLDVEAPHRILGATLYDMLGRVVRQAQPSDDVRRFSIPTNGFPSSAYALEVIMNGFPPALRMLMLP
jgi:photosystem II stability/assembly factor-like uncharacterized protein